MRYCLGYAAFLAAVLPFAVSGAERFFNFANFPLGQQPPGFQSVVAGAGRPGTWKVIADPEAADSGAVTSTPPFPNGRPVLAQLAREATGQHFPILVFNEETYSDFKLTTQFKLAGGALEQAAGIAFRFQNESNFYVVRVSAVDKSIRCYKVAHGRFMPPVSQPIEIAKGSWHELAVECAGTRILCSLDGKDVIKIVDSSSANSPGKIGFWTESDSVGYFADTRIVYTPRESLAEVLVRDALEQFPRLVSLQLFASRTPGTPIAVVASNDRATLGRAAGPDEQDVIETGNARFGRDKKTVLVIMPLRDRNGDPIAAVRIVMDSFPGQTEQNASARARPIVKMMQSRVQSLEGLLR